MRTRVSALGLGFKKLATLFAIAAIAVSCGQNNTSGKKDGNDGYGYGGYGNVGGYGNGQTLPSDWKQRVLTENRCQYGRMQMISGASGVNASAGVYVGVTAEGDVAIITNDRMELYFCNRPDANQPLGGVTQSPIVNNSSHCSVGEISAMDVDLRGNNGVYQLAFYPLHFKGSSLCQGGYPNNYPY